MAAAAPVEGARYRCPSCQQTFRVRSADPAKTYLCSKCRVPLEACGDDGAAAPAPRRVNVSSAQTMFEPPPPVQAAAAAGPLTRLPRLKGEAPSVSPASAPAPDAATLADGLVLDTGAAKAEATDFTRLLPPTFDGYRMIKELGRGGMGAVLLAEQVELRRRVALKVILPWAGTDVPQLRERFSREARAMAKLRYPHIVEVHGTGEVNGLSYLAMEFIEGRTLSEFIEGDRLGFAQAAALAAKVGRALAYAHSRGVIHRDIKPANIMLRHNGEPVLMDFGLAKDFDANTMKLSITGNIIGTPAYMSPEQAQGLKTDERSDIYSLGAVLYEMLTLEPPFEGETTIATMYNVVNTPARPASELRPGVPEALSRICAKALEKDVTERYQTMDELAGDLDRFGAGMAVAARGPTVMRRALEMARANRVRAAAIGAAAAAALLVLFSLQMGWLRRGATKTAELREATTGGSAETRALHVKAIAGDIRDKRLQPGKPEYNDALAALRAAAADTDPTGAVPAAAAEALADAGDKDAQEVIQKLLDQQRPAAVRRAAVEALGRLDAQGLALIMARTIRNDPALEVRLAALEAMPPTIGPDVMVYLIELSVKGDPPAVAAAAVKKLGQVRTQKSLLSLYGGGHTAVVAPAISQMMKVQQEYSQALEEGIAQINPEAKKQRKPFPYELAAKKLKSEDRGERLQAAYDLGVLADVRAEPDLAGALSDADSDVALAAAEALGKLPPLSAPAKVVALLRDPSPSLRQAAARACAKMKPAPDGAGLVEPLLAEKIGPVQAELAVALGRLKFGGATTALVTVLHEGAPEARRKAAWALGQIGDKSACAPLVETLEKSTDGDLKDEIAGALSAITGKAIGPDAAKWREAVKALK